MYTYTYTAGGTECPAEKQKNNHQTHFGRPVRIKIQTAHLDIREFHPTSQKAMKLERYGCLLFGQLHNLRIPAVLIRKFYRMPRVHKGVEVHISG